MLDYTVFEIYLFLAPEAVEDLVVFSTGSDSLGVTWNDPVFKPCPIEEYYYSYELINLDQCEVIEPPVMIREGTTKEQFLSLSGLETYSTYRIYVYGQNDAGNGQIQNQTSVTNSSSEYLVSLHNYIKFYLILFE